jgi:hypothetical protein
MTKRDYINDPPIWMVRVSGLLFRYWPTRWLMHGVWLLIFVISSIGMLVYHLTVSATIAWIKGE